MILVRLIGGLGNQMFQYAAAQSLADRLGSELLLDLRDFASYRLHAYGLERLRPRARAAGEAELRDHPEWQHRVAMPLARAGLPTGRWYREPSLRYDPRWERLQDGAHLNGYFQSERYFAARRAALLQEFVPREELGAANRAVADAARASRSVMIHVRRGDYVSDAKANRKHGVCTPDYYRAAIAHLRERLEGLRFFVFSDDLGWARQNLPLGSDAFYVDGNRERPEMDIHLMSLCRHHVIANSSFSWWGAWLGTAGDQLVVAPAPWFDSPALDSSDLVPSRWIRLPKDGGK